MLPMAGGAAPDRPSRNKADHGYGRGGFVGFRPEGFYAIGDRIPGGHYRC